MALANGEARCRGGGLAPPPPGAGYPRISRPGSNHRRGCWHERGSRGLLPWCRRSVAPHFVGRPPDTPQGGERWERERATLGRCEALTSPVLRVAAYRFRATFTRRRGGYLALVLLIGLVGGVALGALAAARRTQSSFSTYLAATNPSNLAITDFGGLNNGGGSAPLYSSSATATIAHLSGVRHVETGVPILAVPLGPDGGPRHDALSEVDSVASVDGLFFHQDHLTVIAGRRPNPTRADEIAMTPLAARVLKVRVGDVVPYGIYTLDQETLSGFGSASVSPHRRIDARVVALIQVPNAVVQDDIDQFPTFVFFTPALGKELVADAGQGEAGAIQYGLQLDRGNAGVAAVEREFSTDALLQSGNTYGFHTSAPVEAKVDRTIKPLAIALGVFGGVAALATLLIAVQLISRQLRDAAEDLEVLRALGAGPVVTLADGSVGILASTVIGSLVAGVLAVALSPLSPLGPVRPVYPAAGVALDWTVLGFGLIVLVAGLGATALILAYRVAPHRLSRRSSTYSPTPSRAVVAAAAAGFPAPAVVGVRFALEPGRGRSSVPVRSALMGAALAVALVVATLTFGSGLRSLVSHPALYGWNWTYLLNGSNTIPPSSLTVLDHDRNVSAWQGYLYNDAVLDGQSLPFLIQYGSPQTKASVSPPILQGHAVDAKGQVVLGAATLAQLHKHIGDTVLASYGAPGNPEYVPPTRLVIVGTATMPAVGFSSVVNDHTSMGTGVLISGAVLPAAFVQAVGSPAPALDGPNLVFVRMRNGISAAAGKADLQRVIDAAEQVFAAVPGNAAAGFSVAVVGVQRPAEIVNYRTMGAAPAFLSSALAVGAVTALGLTLVASVRRRRRDLALLKTLGFTQQQLVATVSWQASVAAGIGVVFGVPLGIALGRWLWTLFARQIYAVPQPSVPALSVILVAVGALVLANIVAALPGRSAARTSTAVLLRAE